MWPADSLHGFASTSIYMKVHVHVLSQASTHNTLGMGLYRCQWCCNNARFGYLSIRHTNDVAPSVQLPGSVISLARELDPFFWTRWPVLGLRPDLSTVPVTHIVIMTVPTLKMLESPAERFDTSIQPFDCCSYIH